MKAASVVRFRVECNDRAKRNLWHVNRRSESLKALKEGPTLFLTNHNNRRATNEGARERRKEPSWDGKMDFY